jgi:hypothetical protein
VKFPPVVGVLLLAAGCGAAGSARSSEIRGRPGPGPVLPAPSDAPDVEPSPPTSPTPVEVPIGRLPGYEEEKRKANERLDAAPPENAK